MGRHVAADYTIITTRALKDTGNTSCMTAVHDFWWWSCQIHAFCVACWFVYFNTLSNTLSVALTMVTILFFVQCIIKQLDSVLVIPRKTKVSVRVISRSLLRPWLFWNFTKTSSNNILILLFCNSLPRP